MAKQQLKRKQAARSGRVVSFDDLFGNWPTVTIGDIEFEGRHINQVEKARWLTVATADDVDGQLAFIIDALNARGADVDLEWVQQWPDRVLAAIVSGLQGFGWPGDSEEGAEGN